MRVTVAFLEKHDACTDQVELFKKFLGKRKYVFVTRRNIELAAKFGLNLSWLMYYTTGVIHFTDIDGNKYWFKDGKPHRVNGPAVEYTAGTKYWYEQGKLHRVGGPAVEYANGGIRWYKHGKRHRVGGPAVELENGTKYWYENDKYLRSSE